MPAFEIRKRPQGDIRNHYRTCANGCHSRIGHGTTGSDTGLRSATHRMSIHGHDFYLCPPCSREAAQVWAEALEGSTGTEYDQEAA